MSEVVVASKCWAGIASLSRSVFAQKEPRNAKFVFGCVQNFVLDALTRKLGHVRFIQIGANDGISGDALHSHILRGTWSGVLVEPAPAAFERLRATYEAIPKLTLVQRAIGACSGRFPFHVVQGADALSSFSIETIMLHAPKYNDLAGMIHTLEIETLTLDALADTHGCPHPDVLAVDAEGTDDIVLSSFDLEARQPSIIVFEHVALSLESSTRLRDRLITAGYRLIADRHDVLAIREGTFDPAWSEFFEELVLTARNN